MLIYVFIDMWTYWYYIEWVGQHELRIKPILHYCAIVVVMIKNNRILSINFRLAFLSSSFSFLLPFVFLPSLGLDWILPIFYSIQYRILSSSCVLHEHYSWSFATKQQLKWSIHSQADYILVFLVPFVWLFSGTVIIERDQLNRYMNWYSR